MPLSYTIVDWFTVTEWNPDWLFLQQVFCAERFLFSFQVFSSLFYFRGLMRSKLATHGISARKIASYFTCFHRATLC